ncbi:MAG TPA: nucleotidyl transferase AbiEii/AbiGii toxin family protein [Melioribacteraceae bacterium]|nr:nucleotidyl transferase AbiEii/AbiGii toxin family protein [Melioribacteraceae bacterium]
MNETAVKKWFELQDATKQNIFVEISNKSGLPAAAVEKDWWVVRTLDLVFNMDVAPHTVFKGGTSLSKAWKLIDRFSEDIDLALDRKFLGFAEQLTQSQVKKLRERSCSYIVDTFAPALISVYKEAGFQSLEIKVAPTTSDDQDPLIIEVNYPSVTETSEYILPRVLIEIGSRSLIEPNTQKSFSSLVGEYYKEQSFADDDITIPAVNPERTFLEKIFLLHEEFQKTPDKIRVDRLSRHLYDIERIMDSEYGQIALSDSKLYNHIVEHRSSITRIRGIDYSNHVPSKINFIPPDSLIEEWKNDYKLMQESMIYKESLPFDKLLERLITLKTNINQLTF